MHKEKSEALKLKEVEIFICWSIMSCCYAKGFMFKL